MRNNLNNLSGMFSPSQELERMIASPTNSITTRRQNIPPTPSFFASPIASRGGLFSPHSQSLPSLVDDETLWSTNHKTEIFSKDDDDKSSVRVVVRVRPLFDNETQNCIQVDTLTKRSLQVLSNNPKEKPKTFTFDHVANPTTTQKDMFEFCGKPIVDSCLSGYNGTIFCYGQTGSGKTFTMGTAHSEDLMEDDLLSSTINHNLHLSASAGLIPRVLSYTFAEIDRKKHQKDIKFIVSCSFLEIYNERITDLLDTTPKLPLFNGGTVSKSLNLREDIKSGVYVEQLIHEDIISPVEALAILKKGLSNRHVGSTSMNNQSSRSHSVFTIYIKSQEASEGGTKTRTSRLNLIDLAGSERQSTSNTEGDRLKEACSINKSLSTLGKVIKDLVDVANGISRHVQYRDSKLTFLLKDSLGGNSKTCVIANISPAINSLSESLSTLTFAQRAKRIKNEAKINEETSGSVTFLQEQIKLLRRQLLEANKRVSEVPQTPTPQLTMDETEKERYIMELQQQHVYLSTQSDEQDEKNSILTHRIEELKKLASSKDRLLTTTRFLLRLRESKIARLTGKSVKNPEEDFISGLDFDFDRPMSPQKFSKFNFENFSLQNEDQFLSLADSALQKALSPEQHPDVIQLKIENMELKEQLNNYESQFSKEYGTNKELFKELHSYIQSLELSIRHLTGEKEQLANKIQDMEKSHRRNSSILQEQVTISENQTLLGEITRLEQMCEEYLETISSLKKELVTSQEKEQIAWAELENLKQMIEQAELEKEKAQSENVRLKEEQVHIMSIMEDLENQQIFQKEREESMKIVEETFQKQVETLLIELEQTSDHAKNLQTKLEESEQYETTSQQEINSLKSSLLEKDSQIETLIHELNGLQQQLDNNTQQANTALEEIRQREELLKSDSEAKLLETLQQLDTLRQELESTQKLCDESLQANEQSSEEISKLQITIESLNAKIDTLSFREQELLLSLSERDDTIESLKSKLEESGSNEAVLAEQAQQKETLLSSQLEQELSNNCLLASALEEKEKVLMTYMEQIKDLEQQVSTTTLSFEKSIEEVQTLKEHLEATTSSYEKSIEEIQTLNEHLEKSREQHEATTSSYEKSKEQIKYLEQQVSTTTLSFEKSIQEIQILKGQLEATTSSYEKSIEEIQTLKAHLEKSHEQLETTTSSYEKSVEDIQTLSQEIQNNMQTIANKEEEIKEIYGRINMYAEENDQLRENARVSQRDLAEMTEKFKASLFDLEQLKSSHEKAITNLKQCITLEQERNDELLQHLNSIGSTSEEEKKHILENEEKLRKERDEEINSLQQLIEALKFELGENMQANKILTEELDQSNAQHCNQIADLRLSLEKQIQLVQNISNEKDNMFRELNDKLVNENIELKLKETEVSNLTSELESLKLKYSDLQENHDSIAHLAEESIEKLQEHEQKVQQLEEEISRIKTELNSKGKELDQSNHKLNSTLRQLELLKSSSAGTSNENANLLASIESLESQVKSKQIEIDQHLESIHLLQSGEEFIKLTEKLHTLEKKCENVTKTLQNERETLLRKESELNELRNNYDETREQISSLEKQSLSQQIVHEESLNKLKERHNMEKQQLEMSLEALKQKYSDSITEINNLKEELDSLRKDHEKVIGHNNHKQKIQYQLKIKRENDELRDELQRTQKELSDARRQMNPPRPVLFGNSNFEKNVSPTEVPLRDRTSFYVKRAPIQQTESQLPTPLNLSQSALTKDRPTIGRSKMLVSNITTRNFSPVDNKENVEELKTPQTAPSSMNTSSLFGGNRKRRNIGDNANPNETSALFDTDIAESSTKKVKPTEVDEKPKFR